MEPQNIQSEADGKTRAAGQLPKAWEVLEREYLFRRPWLTARRDHVRLPSGVEVPEFYVLEYPEFCNVIAVTREGQFVMEWQYRHAAEIVELEIPAGCVEKGESPLAAAQRELYEETGFGGGTWTPFMTLYPNPSACNNRSHTFLAVDVEPISTQHLEPSEDIRVVLMEPEEVFRRLQQNEFPQALMSAPLWKYFYDRKR
jgi:8-oxo-dGTP pyrophosphatase MutT (NUDIX family)